MTVWEMGVGIIIILGVGIYFWRKPLSRMARMGVAGLTLAACAILWLVALNTGTPEAPDRSDAPTTSRAQKAVPGQAGETVVPVTPLAAKTVSNRNGSEATVDKTPPAGADKTATPASEPVATTNEATGPDSTAVKLNNEQLNALVGDAVPVKLHNSTMVSTVVKKGDIRPPGSESTSEYDYSFPEVIEAEDGLWMIIPDEPLPSISSRRPIELTDGDVPGPGDVVALSYDMFSWSTGKMVESSQTALNGPLMYRLSGKDTPIGIPQYLRQSISNRPYGSTVQVVFKKGMTDLPPYLNPEDGYVLMVRIDAPGTDNEAALENMVNAFNQ